jgi:hypothetical protein
MSSAITPEQTPAPGTSPSEAPPAQAMERAALVCVNEIGENVCMVGTWYCFPVVRCCFSATGPDSYARRRCGVAIGCIGSGGSCGPVGYLSFHRQEYSRADATSNVFVEETERSISCCAAPGNEKNVQGIRAPCCSGDSRECGGKSCCIGLSAPMDSRGDGTWIDGRTLKLPSGGHVYRLC